MMDSSHENIDAQIAALEKSTADLQMTSSKTIAANLEHLSSLQRQLEEDRARLAKQQRRVKTAAPLNFADVEQQRALEVEVNELRKRRDNARDANRQTERRLAMLLEQTERLQHHLSTPEGTPYPVHSARGRDGGKSPAARLDEGLRSLGGSMRAGPAGAAMRASLGTRPNTASGAMLADSKAALLDQQAREKQQRELDAAEARLARAQLRRDTYQHMAERLRYEKQEWDPRFQAAYGELQREKKRVAQLRIANGEAVQSNANAEAVRRRTERRIAQAQAKQKALLAEQQATLLSTQQSVLHFEVSRMSRSASAIQLDKMKGGSSSSIGDCRTASGPFSSSSSAGLDPAAGRRGRAGGGGVGGGVDGEDEAHLLPASLDPSMDPEETKLHQQWEAMMKGTGVSEPIDLIHKALEQLDARTSLEQLEQQTDARLMELIEEGEQLARRRERSDGAVAVASAKRLERLHELVSSAEKELARATASLSVSDSAVREARKGVAAVDELASATVDALAQAGERPQPYARLADPMECESSSLPALMQGAVDCIVTNLRRFDASRERQREAEERAQAEAEAERVRREAEAIRAEEAARRLADMQAREQAAKAEWQHEANVLAATLADAEAEEAEAAERAAAAAAGEDDAEKPEPMFPPLIPPSSPSHLVPAEMA